MAFAFPANQFRTGAQFAAREAHQPNARPYRLVGKTRDYLGAPLGSCTVHLFRTSDNLQMDQQISDASGNFAFSCAGGTLYYVVAYLPGSPDKAGTTINTLQAVA